MNIQDSLAGLEKLGARYQGLREELASLGVAEANLKTQAQKLFTEVSGMVPHEKLILPPAEGGALDDSLDGKVRAMHIARIKLELIPGAKAKTAAKIENVRAQIKIDIGEIVAECRVECRTRLEIIQREIGAQMSKLCGDEQRGKLVSAEAAKNSRLARWYREFEWSVPPSELSDEIKSLVGLVKAFGADTSHLATR